MYMLEIIPSVTARPLQPEIRGIATAKESPGNQVQRQPATPNGGVRDELAQYRSMLANERTLLAYQRTAIMLAVSGFTLLKLLSHQTHALVLGAALLSVALATAIVGFVRFRSMKHHIGAWDDLLTRRVDGSARQTSGFATTRREKRSSQNVSPKSQERRITGDSRV